MAGRKPKPTALKLLQGNAGRRPLNAAEPLPVGDLFAPPGHLTENQVAAWTYAIANAPAGLLKLLDRDLLVAWVVAQDLHRQACEALAKSGLLLRSKDGGTPYQNPYLAIVNRQAELMVKFASELGFTPSSRSRISVGGGDGAKKPGSVWAEFG